jgi:hypothetical protein
MTELLKMISQYELEVETRAFAHYASSNYHRLRGKFWGIFASVFAALTSVVTLSVAATKLLTNESALLPKMSSIFFVYVAIALFVFAVASALEAFLAHPKQASTHMASYAGYSHAMRRLGALRLRCTTPTLTNDELSVLLNLLDEISQQIRDVAAVSIYPLPAAYKKGKEIKECDLAFCKTWETTFGARSSPSDPYSRNAGA